MRELDARSARRLKQETWDFLLEESMFNPVICKVGEMDAVDSSSLEPIRLTENIHTYLECLTRVIELIHRALPVKHL